MSAPADEVGRLCRRAIRLVAEAEGVPPAALHRPRGWPARRARMVAHYLVVVAAGQSIKGVSAASGLHKRAISKAVGRVEELREDSGYDARIEQLEERFQCMA